MFVVLIFGLVVTIPASGMAAKDSSMRDSNKGTRKYFLRRAECGGDDNLWLSTKNGPDTACADMQAGLLNDAVGQTELSETWQSYPAVNGVPFVLNATKPITGEITVYGAGCIEEPACLPQGGLAAGNATLRLVVVAVTKAGKERSIGEFAESFVITPDEPTYTSTFKVWPDEFFSGDRFSGLRLDVQVGGVSYGPGGIAYDDPASFIKVPIFRR